MHAVQASGQACKNNRVFDMKTNESSDAYVQNAPVWGEKTSVVAIRLR